MKSIKNLSVVFGMVGVLFLFFAAALSFTALDAPAKLLAVSKDAKYLTEDYMEALCREDLESLGTMTYGQPRYLSGEEESSELAELLWDAYADSVSYTFSGDCYASAAGVCRDAEVTVLDISGILSELKQQSQKLLEERAVVADGDLVFEEDGQYREEFAMQVLYDGAAAILKEQSRQKTIRLTLELTRQDGIWYVLPNPAVTNLLTGAMGE